MDKPLFENEIEGTPITAELLNNLKAVIKQDDDNARTAYNASKQVFEKRGQIDTAESNSNRALTKSEESITLSTQTQQSLVELQNQVVSKQGTKVTTNGNFVLEFETTSLLNASTFYNNEIIKRVSYDASTDTFNF